MIKSKGYVFFVVMPSYLSSGPEAEVLVFEKAVRERRGYMSLCVWPLSLLSRLVSVTTHLSEPRSHFSFAPRSAPPF